MTGNLVHEDQIMFWEDGLLFKVQPTKRSSKLPKMKKYMTGWRANTSRKSKRLSVSGPGLVAMIRLLYSKVESVWKVNSGLSDPFNMVMSIDRAVTYLGRCLCRSFMSLFM